MVKTRKKYRNKIENGKVNDRTETQNRMWNTWICPIVSKCYCSHIRFDDEHKVWGTEERREMKREKRIENWKDSESQASIASMTSSFVRLRVRRIKFGNSDRDNRRSFRILAIEKIEFCLFQLPIKWRSFLTDFMPRTFGLEKINVNWVWWIETNNFGSFFFVFLRFEGERKVIEVHLAYFCLTFIVQLELWTVSFSLSTIFWYDQNDTLATFRTSAFVQSVGRHKNRNLRKLIWSITTTLFSI